MNKDWGKIISSIPAGTGVYLMKDSSGKVLYVGKALNLRSRVQSYFRETTDTRPAVRFLRNRLDDIDFILTDSEKEALILENNLIKEHHPRYNISLRDDKDYLCLRLTTREKYPRLITLRRPRPSAEPTFGPYSSALELRKTIKLLHKAYPLRTCAPSVFRSRKRPCLNYEMGRCLGPCSLPVDVDMYNGMIHQIRMILGGKMEGLLEELRECMKTASGELRYEDAAKYRDRIQAVEVTLEKQKMNRVAKAQRDAVNMARKAGRVAAARIRVRDGKVIGVDTFHFNAHERSEGEILDEFIRRLYADMDDVPGEILVPFRPDESEAVEEWFSEKTSRRVHIKAPARGEGAALVELALKNAKQSIETELIRTFDPERVLKRLEKNMGLSKTPNRIEGIDISNISGKLAVGSLVRFTDAAPDKAAYRKYRIKGLDEPDDYAMMRQVLERRIKRGIDEDDLPDLILVDGGKGQLNILREVLKELNAPPIDVAGIAKGRDKRVGDRVFIPGRKNHVPLPPDAMNLLQQVRDEAHRFAIEYHRRLRKKYAVASELTNINGIGPSKSKALLKNFGSLKRVREAGVDQLGDVKGISMGEAEAVYDYLHKTDDERDN